MYSENIPQAHTHLTKTHPQPHPHPSSPKTGGQRPKSVGPRIPRLVFQKHKMQPKAKRDVTFCFSALQGPKSRGPRTQKGGSKTQIGGRLEIMVAQSCSHVGFILEGPWGGVIPTNQILVSWALGPR